MNVSWKCVCGKAFEGPLGDSVCPGCGAVHTADTARVPVRCSCGAALRAPVKMAGRQTTCPACSQPVVVPDPAAVDVAPPPPPPIRPAPIVLRRAKPALSPEPSLARRAVPWLFALTLLPLIAFTFAGDDTAERFKTTIEKHGAEIAPLMEKEFTSQEAAMSALCNALPGHRIEGATLPRDTWAHWVFALSSATVFWALLMFLFPNGNARIRDMWRTGIFVGTIGILLLLGVQLAAMFSQGVWITGRGVIMLVFYVIKFIGFSYRAALDADNGFFMSFFGFTFGVGLCEEVCKALPLLAHFRRKGTLDMYGALIWGLACGIGFGVSEGITYSSDMYNGLSTGGIYWVRFVSCVALHAVWNGATAVLLWRFQSDITDIGSWHDWFVPIFKLLGISMVLHGLYDTLLKRGMPASALFVAVLSFAWMFAVIEWGRKQQREFDALNARAAV